MNPRKSLFQYRHEPAWRYHLRLLIIKTAPFFAVVGFAVLLALIISQGL